MDKVDEDGYVRKKFYVIRTDASNMIRTEPVYATNWEIQEGCLVFMLFGPGVPNVWDCAYSASSWSKVFLANDGAVTTHDQRS